MIFKVTSKADLPWKLSSELNIGKLFACIKEGMGLWSAVKMSGQDQLSDCKKRTKNKSWIVPQSQALLSTWIRK